MPFKKPSNADGDLRQRLEELEAVVAGIARDHKAAVAEFTEQIEMLWTVAAPRWLIEAVVNARSGGWLVERRIDAIVFHRPEGDEHRHTLAMPLPDELESRERLRQDLQLKLLSFSRAA